MADEFKPCSVDGCNRNAHPQAKGKRGYCQRHYHQLWRRGELVRLSKPKSGYEKCLVDGCNGDPKQYNTAHGYCFKHYQRWKRHGDPLGGRTGNGELMAWLEAHVDYGGDDCLKWPYTTGKNGYGMVSFRGVRSNSSRVMCVLAHGEPPTSRHEAAHICGKGHEACVNPSHLAWKTTAENHLDKVIHGTTNRSGRLPTSCLSERDVLYIRRVAGTVTQKSLADKFGVDQSHINKIIKRKVWAWLE